MPVEKVDGTGFTNITSTSQDVSDVDNALRQRQQQQQDQKQNQNEDSTTKDIEHGLVTAENFNELDEKELEPRDPDLVDWEGPDDPENPMNWPRGRKLLITITISFITLLTYVYPMNIRNKLLISAAELNIFDQSPRLLYVCSRSSSSHGRLQIG